MAPSWIGTVPAESENMLAPVAVTVVDAVEVMVKARERTPARRSTRSG